jgi:hypothetical protein
MRLESGRRVTDWLQLVNSIYENVAAASVSMDLIMTSVQQKW